MAEGNTPVPQQVHATIHTTTENISVPANSGKEIVGMDNVIGSNTFVSATLLSGTIAGLANLFIHETYWGGTRYLTAKNITGGILTIPSGTVIRVVYFIM